MESLKKKKSKLRKYKEQTGGCHRQGVKGVGEMGDDS